MRRSIWLADLSWPEVETLAADKAILAVPIGSTEQHGPHLPLSTDTDLAVAICERLAESAPNVIVAPALGYGSSGEHAGFPGTISIGQQATEFMLVELGRSACETFSRVLFVSAHGGNAEPVRRAIRQLTAEGRDVRGFEPRWHGEPHAGSTETSMLLAIAPGRVRMQLAEPGNIAALDSLMPALMRGGVKAVSRNGVLGDPTRASAASGFTLLDRIVADAAASLDNWDAPRSRVPPGAAE